MANAKEEDLEQTSLIISRNGLKYPMMNMVDRRPEWKSLIFNLLRIDE